MEESRIIFTGLTTRQQGRSRPLVSIVGMSLRSHEPDLNLFHQNYAIRRILPARLTMADAAWAETFAAMGVPREFVEYQSLVTVRDLHLMHETIFNTLRSRRTASPSGPDPAELIEQERLLHGCLWCDPNRWHVLRDTLWVDAWGPVRSEDGRVGTRANWARQAKVNGLVFGDHHMHNFLRLTQAEFVSLFTTAEKYIAQARQHEPSATYWMIFMNGGRKSAGSVAHAHLQVVAREDRHFAYPEVVAARCPKDYWDRVRAIHEDLGLAVRAGHCVAWANIAPVKERDITVISPTIRDGAAFLHEILQVLTQHGTNSWSLAAIPSPEYVTGHDPNDRFSSWPPVLWRFVDRGDLRVPHGDIGCMELFGSSVVATDPFLVAQWLNGTVTW